MKRLIGCIALVSLLLKSSVIIAGRKRGTEDSYQSARPCKRLKYASLSSDELVARLAAAVYRGDTDMACKLLAAGADSNRVAPQRGRPLHIAVLRGWIRMITILLNAGARINDADAQGNSPLCVAVMRANSPMVKLLLDRGADGSLSNQKGEAPLHFASRTGNLRVVRALLCAGVDSNMLTQGGYTPLFFAAKKGYCGVIRALLQGGADPAKACSRGLTALHGAIGTGMASVVSILLKAGAPVDAVDGDGYTPLHRASAEGEVALANMLIQAGANLDAITSDGCTPLHNTVHLWPAQKDNCIRLAGVLLQAGADMNIIAPLRGTPIQQAAASCALALVQLLIDWGAELISNKEGPKTVLELLHEHLSIRQKRRHRLFLEQLNERYASAMGDDGDSILHRLLLSNSPDDALMRHFMMFRLPIEDGSYYKPALYHKNQEGKTPLHVAAEKRSKYIKQLLAYGADRAATTPSGETMDSIMHEILPTVSIDEDGGATTLMYVASRVSNDDPRSLTALCTALKSEKNPAYVTNYYNSALRLCPSKEGRTIIQTAVRERRWAEICTYLQDEHDQPKVLAELQLEFAEAYEGATP